MVSYIKIRTKLGVLENRVLKNTLGRKSEEMTRDWKNYIMRSVMISVPRHVILHRLNKGKYNVWRMSQELERRKIHKNFDGKEKTRRKLGRLTHTLKMIL
jgi:hypothetical protein